MARPRISIEADMESAGTALQARRGRGLTTLAVWMSGPRTQGESRAKMEMARQ